MSRCLVCGEPLPDIPSTVPVKFCTTPCRDRVADAVARFLDVLAAPETDTPTDDEGIDP